MYSLDSLSNHTLPHKPRASDAHSDMLGKRHTLLNHDSFHSFFNSVDENTNPLKKQKVAAHINTRHVASHFLHPGHQQSMSKPTQSLVDPPRSPLALQEPLAGSSTKIQQPSTSYVVEDAINSDENVFMDEINIHPANDDTTGQSDSNASSLDSRESSNNITLVHTLDSLVLNDNHTSNQVYSRQEGQSSSVPQAVTNTASDILSDDDIMAAVHVTGFFERVQSWASSVEQLCNAREKQLLYLELFGDKPTFTLNSFHLLNLLKEIDQQKNLVTLQEAHFTNLVEKIDKVFRTYTTTRDWQIISLVTRILDNFYQRFQNRRFP